MDFVVGATGVVGNEICRLLSKAGSAPRVLTRTSSDSDRVKTLSEMGCEIVTGDLASPDSIANACEDVTTVYLDWCEVFREFTVAMPGLHNSQGDGLILS